MINQVNCKHGKTKRINPMLKPATFSLDTKRLLPIVGLLGLLLAGPAAALKPEPNSTIEKHLRPNQIQSVDDIARQIRQQHKWRILAAEPTIANEKTLYRFKLLNKQRGRVSVVVIDPKQPNLKTLN